MAADKDTPTIGDRENLRSPTFATSLAGRGGILFWSMLALAVVVLLVVIARLLPQAPTD